MVFSPYEFWSCTLISEPLKRGASENSRCMILAAFLLRYERQDSIFGKDVDDIILDLSLIALQLCAYCHGVWNWPHGAYHPMSPPHF